MGTLRSREMSNEEIRKLAVGDFTAELSEGGMGLILEAFDAFWKYPEGRPKPNKPHVELTSGRCSNGFVNLRGMLSHTNMCEFLAQQLAMGVKKKFDGPIDWVVGSSTAATDLSHDVARFFGARHYPMWKQADGSQVLKGVEIPPDSCILHVEELITTSKSALAVRKSIREVCPSAKFVPIVPTILYRPSPGETFGIEGSSIWPLMRWTIDTWEPGKCPLCAAGSKKLRPNIAENWSTLVDSMD